MEDWGKEEEEEYIGEHHQYDEQTCGMGSARRSIEEKRRKIRKEARTVVTLFFFFFFFFRVFFLFSSFPRRYRYNTKKKTQNSFLFFNAPTSISHLAPICNKIVFLLFRDSLSLIIDKKKKTK
jgi:hypothetical protein